METKLQTKYLENWEEARVSQNKQKLTLAENKIRDKENDFLNKIEIETFVHADIETFMEEVQQVLQWYFVFHKCYRPFYRIG